MNVAVPSNIEIKESGSRKSKRRKSKEKSPLYKVTIDFNSKIDRGIELIQMRDGTNIANFWVNGELNKMNLKLTGPLLADKPRSRGAKEKLMNFRNWFANGHYINRINDGFIEFIIQKGRVGWAAAYGPDPLESGFHLPTGIVLNAQAMTLFDVDQTMPPGLRTGEYANELFNGSRLEQEEDFLTSLSQRTENPLGGGKKRKKSKRKKKRKKSKNKKTKRKRSKRKKSKRKKR